MSERPRRFLVCAPEFFDAHFLFNPFMTYRERVDRRRARVQWRRLVRVLEEAGAELRFLEPSPVSGALPFTADGAFCYAPGRALVLRNDGPRGELEPRVFKAWLEAAGYAVEALPPRYRLDGGNLLRLPDGRVLAGLKPGAAGLAERYLDRLLRLTAAGTVSTVRLVDERHLHLDTAAGHLGGADWLVFLEAFADGRMPASGPLAEADPIAVGRSDARRFACNVVVVDDVVVTGPVSEGLARRIGRRGYHVERVELGEFFKAGGGAKCLTLPLLPTPDEEVSHEERGAERDGRAAARRPALPPPLPARSGGRARGLGALAPRGGGAQAGAGR